MEKSCIEPVDISVIYQDHHLLIVNKPAGMVIHPTYKHADGTFWDALLAYTQRLGIEDWQPPDLPDDPQWAGAPPAVRAMLRQRRRERQWQEEGILPRPCLLHRLDKDTSGVVALTRTERARRHLVQQFYDHTITKRYLALARPGSPTWAQPRVPLVITHELPDGQSTSVTPDFIFTAPVGTTFLLAAPLQRDPDERRRCIVGSAGQDAQTRFRLLARDPHTASLLFEAQPITGRTHQIRAHLAALGCPIIGDQTYAPSLAPSPIPTLTRQFLHASSLTVRDYPTNALRTFGAPLPEDLLTWLRLTCPSFISIYEEIAPLHFS